MKAWRHNDLLDDLAAHLGRNGDKMIWTDVPMGHHGSCRPDVYTINKSFSRPRPMAYEIKISRADFRSDATSGKWMQYLDYACAVTFCVPKGLIEKSDLPEGCGLMTRSDKGWRTVKAPTLNPIDGLPQDVWLKLLMGRWGEMTRERIKPRDARINWDAAGKERQKLAERVRQIIKDAEAAQFEIEVANSRAANIVDTAQAEAKKIKAEAAGDTAKIRTALMEVLDIPEDRFMNFHSVAEQLSGWIQELKDALDANAEIKRLRGVLDELSGHIDSAREMPAPEKGFLWMRRRKWQK